jgi:pimeloyl-ACP methyl ester carboxylesterase
LNFTPDRSWESSKEALAIGKALGDKVILMSTSTGGTMALILAAEFPSDVTALINLSPNIKLFHPLAFISNDPWGVQIARMVVHDKYNVYKPKPGQDEKMIRQYWNDRYRLEAVSQLEEMIEDKMTSKTFAAVKQPSLTLYYYKDESEQDSTVSVPAIIKMNEELGTPVGSKSAVPIPNAGDHVIGCYFRSKGVAEVEAEIEKFAIEKLGLTKKGSSIVKN